jgi:hypothetical protein
MWSKHSRRIEPISLSTKAFCQGLRGAVITSFIPSNWTRERNSRLLLCPTILGSRPLKLEPWRKDATQAARCEVYLSGEEEPYIRSVARTNI